MTEAQDLRRLSPRQFAYLGFFEQAYIRIHRLDGIAVYAVHDASGSVLSWQPNEACAQAVVIALSVQRSTLH
jgi:hypothetical protein